MDIGSLELLTVGLCLKYGHCTDLSKQYFYYKPETKQELGEIVDRSERITEALFGRYFVKVIGPMTSLAVNQEASVKTSQNTYITFKNLPDKIQFGISYNFK